MLERGANERERAPGLELELYKNYGWVFDSIPHAPAKLLDLGCGHGMQARGFDSRFPNLTVEGLDWYVKFFKETNPHLKAYEIDIRDMNFRNKYDVVFSGFGFSFFREKDFPIAFNKIQKALKSEGKFCFSYAAPKVNRSGKRDPTVAEPDDGLRMTDAREKLKEWLEDAGFGVESIRKRKKEQGGDSFNYLAVKATKKA